MQAAILAVKVETPRFPITSTLFPWPFPFLPLPFIPKYLQSNTFTNGASTVGDQANANANIGSICSTQLSGTYNNGDVKSWCHSQGSVRYNFYIYNLRSGQNYMDPNGGCSSSSFFLFRVVSWGSRHYSLLSHLTSSSHTPISALFSSNILLDREILTLRFSAGCADFMKREIGCTYGGDRTYDDLGWRFMWVFSLELWGDAVKEWEFKCWLLDSADPNRGSC